MEKKISVSLFENTVESVRYSAYTCTDDFWVKIIPSENNSLDVIFRSKYEKNTDQAEKKFFSELNDEKIREKSRLQNIATSEMIIREAMHKFTPTAVKAVKEEISALSQEQEQELDDLIAEVEKELQEEMNSSRTDDPQHITKTWEEVNNNGK